MSQDKWNQDRCGKSREAYRQCTKVRVIWDARSIYILEDRRWNTIQERVLICWAFFWENKYIPTLDNEAIAARYRRWRGMEGGKFQVDWILWRAPGEYPSQLHDKSTERSKRGLEELEPGKNSVGIPYIRHFVTVLAANLKALFYITLDLVARRWRCPDRWTG